MKRGFLAGFVIIILVVLVVLLASGLIYLNFFKDGFQIKSKDSALNIQYNTSNKNTQQNNSIEINTTAVDQNETLNITNSTSKVQNYSDYQILPEK